MARTKAKSTILVAAALLVAGSAVLSGCGERWNWWGRKHRDRIVWTPMFSVKERQVLFNDNNDFYDSDGAFKEESARWAYYDFLRWKNYEIGELDEDDLEDRIWVTDFGTGKFTTCGMGILFWTNKKGNGYSSMEVLLLPKQIVPEHWYEQVGGNAPGPKTVHCRYGSVYLYGSGTPSKRIQGEIPKFLKLYTNVFSEQVLKATETAELPQPDEKRWKQAGPTGAILSEYSTFTDLDALRFTSPKVKMKNR